MPSAKRIVPVSPLVSEMARRRRHQLLAELLDRLDAEYGPVDEGLIDKYVRLLA